MIQDRGFGHAVSPAPLERIEPEISCMDRQSCLGNGAPVKSLDTEPGVSSLICKCSLPAFWHWEHKAAHDTLGRGNQNFISHFLWLCPLYLFPGQFFYLYFLKSCNPLDIYQEKTILCKDKCTSVFIRASLGAQAVKNLPAVWETWVQYLGWKDPLEERMATHSNILAIIVHGDNPHEQRNKAGYNPSSCKESGRIK